MKKFLHKNNIFKNMISNVLLNVKFVNNKFCLKNIQNIKKNVIIWQCVIIVKSQFKGK